jgi:hypothetical protein
MLVLDDYRPGEGDDNIVLLDIESGREIARTVTGSPLANGMFPCPGMQRDFYYVSNPAVARVFVTAA